MKVRILIQGPFSDFEAEGHVGVTTRLPGDEVDYPAWYAQALVTAGTAEIAIERQPCPGPDNWPEPPAPKPVSDAPGGVEFKGTTPLKEARKRTRRA